MQRQPVESRLLRSIGYDPAGSVLEVELVEGGRIYAYYDVPYSSYIELMEAESKGSYFNEHIRDLFAYEERLDLPGSPEALLDQVVDRESFFAFVEALVEEREHAERMEDENPVRYQSGGALGWNNSHISHFLQAAVACFRDSPLHRPEDAPSWKTFAEFLYCGKIYE